MQLEISHSQLTTFDCKTVFALRPANLKVFLCFLYADAIIGLEINIRLDLISIACIIIPASGHFLQDPRSLHVPQAVPAGRDGAPPEASPQGVPTVLPSPDACSA